MRRNRNPCRPIFAGVLAALAANIGVAGQAVPMDAAGLRAAAAASDVVGALAQPRNTIGVRRIAVLLLRFNDDAAPAYDAADFETLLEEVNRFYREVSYGQFSYSWDIFGPLAIAMNRPCSGNEQVREAPAAARAAAAAMGIDLAPYQTIVFAGSGCGPPAAGGAYVYILRPGVNARILAHELGHTLGIFHADYLHCPGSAYVPHAQLRSYLPNDSGCTRLEYGDLFDVMGSGFHHLNAVHKEALGWLTPLEIRDSGIYRIAPIEAAVDAPRALKILPEAEDPVYVEYRQPIGFDRYSTDFRFSLLSKTAFWSLK